MRNHYPHYQIVKHGTKIEQPILVGFSFTDIDAAQGVQTNLANLVEIIPTESNRQGRWDYLYDATSGVVGLNGSKDLPKRWLSWSWLFRIYSYLSSRHCPKKSE